MVQMCKVTDDGKYRIENLNGDTLEGALRVLRESFFIDEAACVGSDISSSPQGQLELELLSLDTARDGVSLVAVTNDEERQVVAIAFNKLQMPSKPGEQSYFDKFQRERCQDEASKSLITYMMRVDAKTDLFKLYNVECILEIMFLATLKTHRNHGLAKLLCHCSWLLAMDMKNNPKPIKNLKLPSKYANFELSDNEVTMKSPEIVSAIFTSSHSQKVGDRAGFEHVLEVSYEEFIYKGKTFASRIGVESPTTRLCVKKLN